ncbi:ferric uptake regulator, Fur family [Caldicellulosiruptor hydrothermalis 108]|uniref:Ferric uptake regulator, Fur family n=1 Tax=Caldicellulosiruptor hydrothermalis (strain DSM 18901 / VKM B-2411 / 108) TaxID=632292 RepID=E4Q9Q4_CALH1|nr:Fur family transcriptional regulator [Caldicellulosiruptor hydrothermalis]ADQ08159.1 ferric uptake regulator, Fur family [Caldicellulosiruptor hydrothermalis 108]
MAFLKSKLLQKGIKPSLIRLKVYEYLVNHKTHPTVDEIYSSLVLEIPTLSKTSVYNTLSLFVEKGLAQIITIEENIARFDADTSVHGHFQCKSCGKIYDFSVKPDSIQSSLSSEFIVDEIYVYYKGICPYCKNKNN